MARNTGQNDDDLERYDEEGEARSPDEVDNVLAEIGQETQAAITVKRTKYANGKPCPREEFIYKTTPSAFDIEDLRDAYGGGEFRLYISRNGKLWRNLPVAIAAPIKSQEPPRQDNSDMKEFMREMSQRMESQQNQMLQMVMTVLQSQQNAPQSGTDPMQMMNAMMQNMMSMKDFLGLQGGGASGTSAKEQMEYLMKGIELARELNSGESSDDNAFSLLKETLKTFGGPISKMVESTQQKIDAQTTMTPAPSRSSQGNGVAASSSAPSAAVQPGQSSGNEPDKMAMALKPHLQFLKVQAAKNKDPAFYAEVILDQIPDAYFAQFVDYLSNPDLVDRLVKVDPQVQAFRGWFESLRQNIVQILNEDAESSEVDSDSAGADTSGSDPVGDPHAVNDAEKSAKPSGESQRDAGEDSGRG